MTPSLRRCSAALLLVPLMILLAGCVKFDSAMTISSDDKVDATMLIAVQKQYAGLVREACSPKGNSTIPNATITAYDEDDYVGCTLNARGVPMTQLAKSASSWTLSHENDQYSFGMASAKGSTGGPGMSSEMFTSFKVAVTFPGDVTSHNGSSTLEGTTVTWTDPDDMMATDGLKATSKEASPLQAAMSSIIGLVIVLLAAGIAILIWTAVRRRRGAKILAAPLSDAGTFAVHYEAGYPATTPASASEPTVWPFPATPSHDAPDSERSDSPERLG